VAPRFPTLGSARFPVQLHLPGVRLVSLAARVESVQIPLLIIHVLLTPHANSTLHALGADGSVYVWGGCLRSFLFRAKPSGDL